MSIQPDFEELLRLLEEHRVDYMVVGGYAGYGISLAHFAQGDKIAKVKVSSRTTGVSLI